MRKKENTKHERANRFTYSWVLTNRMLPVVKLISSIPRSCSGSTALMTSQAMAHTASRLRTVPFPRRKSSNVEFDTKSYLKRLQKKKKRERKTRKWIRARRTGQIFVYFAKNLSLVALDKCARWFLDLSNFVKAYQTSKTPSSCLWAGRIFVRRESWWFEEKCQSRKFDLYF